MGLRIAYLVSRFPKLSETFIVDEILALERRGSEVSIFSLRAGGEPVTHPEAAPLAARVRVLPLISHEVLAAQLFWALRAPGVLLSSWARTLVTHLRDRRALTRAGVALLHAAVYARALRRAPVDRVHAHWATHTALGAWLIGRLTGIPYGFTAHADDIYVRRPMLLEKCSGADLVVTISEYNRAFLSEQLGETLAERIEVVHCGVPTRRFEVAPMPGGERLEMVCVARLEPKKGHVHLIDACARLREAGVGFRCRLIGEGPERGVLETRIRSLGLEEHVALEGAQPRTVVLRRLAEAHVAVLACIVTPSGRADGIPVALMEAMATGRPVVATQVSGLPELVIDEQCGLLVPPGDPAALAEALGRLASDPALVRRLGEGARAQVLDGFDIDECADRLLSLFGRPSVSSKRPVSAAARLAKAGAEDRA